MPDASSDGLIVTLDGPAGSGKSTVARRLANRLAVDFLDTGAMYRGLTAMALLRGIDPEQEPFYVVELARNCPLTFDWSTDPPRLQVRGMDLTDRLRDADVTGSVSDVAKLPGVRQVLVQNQRRIGQEHPRLVTEGRDQGSVVFPHAHAKFYLDANATVRAERRADQLKAAGVRAEVDQIRREILARDEKDSTREEAPLICPEDALRVDTSDMTLDQVVDHLEQHVKTHTTS
ncbi:MAG: (d)CMP kinase [Planctomycetota bacterium]